VGTAASFVSGVAAFTRREQDGFAGLAARGAWAPAPSSPVASGAISSGAPTSCAFAGVLTRVNPAGGPVLPFFFLFSFSSYY